MLNNYPDHETNRNVVNKLELVEKVVVVVVVLLRRVNNV